MHMSDALISAGVGTSFLAVSGAAIAYAAKRIRSDRASAATEQLGFNPSHPAFSGMMAAFVFAAQMINFTIPGTGSSGHLGGGMLLAMALGSWSGFIAIAAVLIVQAFFFADGGILALGVNIFNLGVIPALLIAPIIRNVPGIEKSPSRRAVASAGGAWISLMLGAFMVTVQTMLSGKTSLPFTTFAALMLGIHAMIGIVEGVVTYFVLVMLHRRQHALPAVATTVSDTKSRMATVIGVIAAITVIVASVLSLYASEHPDGLEWAIERTTGSAELDGDETALHALSSSLQTAVSFMPDYSFPVNQSEANEGGAGGVSLAGILGSVLTLAAVAMMTMLARAFVPIRSNACGAHESKE